MIKETSHQLEKCMMRFAAPTLEGVKCGCIFNINMENKTLHQELAKMNSIMNGKGIRSMILRSSGKEHLIYTYRYGMLNEILSNDHVLVFLRKCGYAIAGLGAMIRHLRERMTYGMVHEIGIFLGYPLEDVIGFMIHKGKKYRAIGCWKVYGDTEKAENLFDKIRTCRARYSDALNRGQRLHDMMI